MQRLCSGIIRGWCGSAWADQCQNTIPHQASNPTAEGRNLHHQLPVHPSGFALACTDGSEPEAAAGAGARLEEEDGNASRPCRCALRLARQRHRSKELPTGPSRPDCHHFHAVVNAIAHIHIKPPWLAKQGFVAGGAAAVAVAGGLALAIRLRFHNHAPEQLAIRLAFHQQAADQLGGNLLGGAGKEGVGKVLGGRGGYGMAM